MRKFDFVLTGFMPLLMHADDIDGADELEAWRKNPRNKNISKAGDDRSPAWTWQTYLYHHKGCVVMPSENIMAALRTAGAQLILKKQKTFKEVSQSGLLIAGECCNFFSGGQTVSYDQIQAFRDEPWQTHIQKVESMGFTLFKKRARVGTSKHIRVRPKFDSWSVTGTIMVLKEEITQSILEQLFQLAGRAGLCDWRPGCKTPGPYGQFEASLSEVK